MHKKPDCPTDRIFCQFLRQEQELLPRGELPQQALGSTSSWDPQHHPGASLPVFLLAFTPHYSGTQALQQSHTSFPPSANISIPDNKNERKDNKKRKQKRKGLAFLCRHKMSTDTCNLLQQSKPCFAGLLISPIVLAQEQVSQSSSQVGSAALGNRSSSLAIYRGNVVVATVKHLTIWHQGKIYCALHWGHKKTTNVFWHGYT